MKKFRIVVHNEIGDFSSDLITDNSDNEFDTAKDLLRATRNCVPTSADTIIHEILVGGYKFTSNKESVFIDDNGKKHITKSNHQMLFPKTLLEKSVFEVEVYDDE